MTTSSVRQDFLCYPAEHCDVTAPRSSRSCPVNTGRRPMAKQSTFSKRCHGCVVLPSHFLKLHWGRGTRVHCATCHDNIVSQHSMSFVNVTMVWHSSRRQKNASQFADSSKMRPFVGIDRFVHVLLLVRRGLQS